MESLHAQLVRKTGAEAIYTRERQRVNRERFRAYCRDYQVARDRNDYRRVAEVVQDATAITSDTLRLVRQMREIHARWRALASDTRFAGECASSSPRTKGVRLIHADRCADVHDMH